MADEQVVAAATDQQQEPLTPETTSAVTPEVGESVADGTQEPTSEVPEHKRKGGWQRKIERLEQEKEFLMQELLRRGAGPEEPKPTQAPKPAVADDDPEPDAETWTGDTRSYVKALAQWEARQMLKQERQREQEARKQTEAKTEEQQLVERWQQQQDSAREKYPDFDEAMQVPVLPRDPAKAQFMRLELMRCEHSVDVGYHLATHPEETRALAGKSELEILRHLARLDARFAQPETPAAEKKEITPPPPTRAPKPLEVPRKSSAVAKPFDVNDPTVPTDVWLRERARQLREKRN